MNIELHLRIAGIIMLLLVAMNIFEVPRRFRWREELTKLSLLNRQVFQVHAAFICIILVMFAMLLLFLTHALMEPIALARGVLGALAAFWFLRLLTQWFVYDWRLWRGHRFNTIMHFVFTGIWCYFTTTFVCALLHK